MQIICTLLQTDNHASTTSLNFLDRMLLLTSNQQCQNSEGNTLRSKYTGKFLREDESDCSNKNHWIVSLLPLNNFVDRQHHLTVSFQILLQSLQLLRILQHITACLLHKNCNALQQ